MFFIARASMLATMKKKKILLSAMVAMGLLMGAAGASACTLSGCGVPARDDWQYPSLFSPTWGNPTPSYYGGGYGGYGGYGYGSYYPTYQPSYYYPQQQYYMPQYSSAYSNSGGSFYFPNYNYNQPGYSYYGAPRYSYYW